MASANALNFTKNLANAYFGSGSFKVMVVTSVPSEANLDAYAFRSDVTNETTGTGYTAGGIACTVTVGSIDTTNNRTPVTLSNLPSGWTSSTFTGVGCWLYKVIGSAATDQLCGYIDFAEGTVSSSGSAFSITFTTPLYVNR